MESMNIRSMKNTRMIKLPASDIVIIISPLHNILTIIYYADCRETVNINLQVILISPKIQPDSLMLVRDYLIYI